MEFIISTHSYFLGFPIVFEGQRVRSRPRDMFFFKNRTASRCFIDFIHDWRRSAEHASKLDALLSLALSFCDGANTSTVPSAVVARVMVASTEVQATSVVGERRTVRTRPVVAVLTHAVSISTVAPASSRQEDTVAVRTGNLITFMSALGCPCPIAFCTEFFKLSNPWHAPRAAPVGSGGIILRITRYIVWQLFYICMGVAVPKV